MFQTRRQLLVTTALAGALVLHPIRLLPEPEARTVLAPDSLVRAVAGRDARLFELCLAERLDVNTSDEQGRTPLLGATLQGDQPVLERLLALGAKVDLPDKSGRTPLMLAAAQGNLDLLRTFLARSTRPAAVDADGRSAAHHALAAAHYDCFELLLPLLPDLNLPISDGRDLLAVACDSGNVRMLKAVLNRLPSGLEWTPRTRAALRAALAAQDSDLTKLLLCKHHTGPTVEGGTIPLLAQAVVEDDAPTFRALLAAGADANTTLPTPCDKEFVARIRSEDLRGYVKADKGITVLMLAAGLGKTEYVRALLDAGASRHRATGRYKMLALYFAAHAREATCVQTLLGSGPSREQLRVEISLAAQKASVIKDGIAILNTSISTGRKGFDTPAGEYVITDKDRDHVSTVYHVEMPYFMRLNCLDFGMHAGHVPDYPASHGCIRLPHDAAQKIFSEIPVGTVVTIN